MNNRIDDPRFHGAGVIGLLFCGCCFVCGLVIGCVLGAALT